MATLWVFGDSFSHIHDNSIDRRYKSYREYCNGNLPKTWSELLASKLKIRLRNCANSGASNYAIFQWFCDYCQIIQPGDLVIIGWSFKERFRLINHHTGQFECIRPNSIQITQTKEFLKDISLSTIDEILLNRTESEWKSEVYSWEHLITLLASKIGFNICYWTFDDTLHKKNYIGGDTNSLMETLLTNGATTIKMETNGVVNDLHFGEQGHIVQSKYFYEFLLKNKIIYNE